VIFSGTNHILVVDDEPDVLSLSKLVMRNIRVYGIPTQIHAAASKAEAIELYGKLTTGAGTTRVMVAFIDIVMESDTAGLELCEYIRKTRGNKYSTLYVRTGQPGIAPPRTVIDDYDINGYLAKPEATEEKLYTLMKAGIRNYYYTSAATGMARAITAMLETDSREGLRRVLGAISQGWLSTESGERASESVVRFPCAFVADGVRLTGESDVDPADLAGLEAKPLNDKGDTFAHDDQHCFMLKIAPSATTSEFSFYGRAFAVSPELVPLWHNLSRSIAAMWKRNG
jgi:CheY-like chemotaxis protein